MLQAAPALVQQTPHGMLAIFTGEMGGWEVGHRPKWGSLWLLPSGPDQVGEALARANLSRLDIGNTEQSRKERW